VFLAPPQGEKRQLDLVARLKLQPGAPPPRAGVKDLAALVHVEVESPDSAAAFRPRMFDYYVQLRRDTGLPVLPIALFLRVGLDGIGWDAYEEEFWEPRIIRFEYAYVGLPALDGEQYATGENLLGVALSALMRQSADRRAALYAEGLKRHAPNNVAKPSLIPDSVISRSRLRPKYGHGWQPRLGLHAGQSEGRGRGAEEST
jgi:hypothetical protein